MRLMLVFILFFSLFTAPAKAKIKNFQRYYRGSRSVRIRHGSRTLNIKPDHRHSAYKERQFYVLPAKRHSQAYKGYANPYIWDRHEIRMITFHDKRLQRSPQARGVNSSQPREINVWREWNPAPTNRYWTWPRNSKGPLVYPRLYHHAEEPNSRPKPSDWRN